MRRASPRPAIVVLIAALVGMALATAVAAQRFDGDVAVHWFAVPALVPVMVAASYLHIEFRHGKDDVDALDLFEAALAPAIFVFPGLTVIALAALGKGLAEAALRVQPIKAAFNVASWAAAAGTGTLVQALLTGGDSGPVDLAGLVVSLGAVAAVNKGALITVLTLAGQRSPSQSVRELRPAMFPGWLIGGGVTLAFGVLFAACYRWAPHTAWLFLVPLGVLHWAGRGYASSRADLRRVEGMRRAAQALASTADVEVGLERFLHEVRQCFSADAVEMALVVDDGAVVHTVDAGGGGARSGIDPSAVRPLVDLDGVHRVGDGEDGPLRQCLRSGPWREALVAPVRTGDVGVGALCVYNPLGLATAGTADLALLESLAAEAAGALLRSAADEVLRRSEARFRGLVQWSSDLVTVSDAEGIVTEVVPSRRADSTGVLEPTVGQPAVAAAHPEDVGLVRAALESLVDRPGAVETVRWRARATDGTWRQLETVVTNMLEEPAVAGLVLNSRDITERERAADLMMAQAEVLASIARQSTLDETVAALSRVVDAQVPGSRYTVVLMGQVLGPEALLGAPLAGAVIDRIRAASDLGAARGRDVESRGPVIIADVSADPAWRDSRRPSGPAAVWAAPIQTSDEGGPDGFSIVHFDEPRAPDPLDRQLLEVTAHLAHIAVEGATSQARLVHQASHDPLTGLPNRRLFLDRTALALARIARTGRSVAVLFVDLDRFKAVNDSLGHEAGDQLLVELAQRMAQVMRPSDTVARFGGDEFTILCDDVHDPAEAAGIAARVRAALAKPIRVDGEDVHMTASVGIACTADPTRRPQELVEDADAAMYRSKKAGGNHHRVYEPAMRTKAKGEWATAQALREALERDELRVYYQPTVSLANGRILGAEALVRWEHAELGIVEPSQFIGLAEETGLIVPMGRLVLEEACRQTRRWHDFSGGEFAMSVNLSARQFSDPSLPRSVADALRRAGASPDELTLEITESVLMRNAESTLRSLRELKDLGVGLAIDDFGTGYSSLSYLRQFPVDVIKVDRSFVSGLGQETSDQAIVGAVISLADTLGLTAVAEGVETVEQVRILQSLGCDVAQGFYFSRAVPAEAFDPRHPSWDL